jgi:hypothetical protein
LTGAIIGGYYGFCGNYLTPSGSQKGKDIMKAAVLHKFGKAPRHEDFADPTPGQDEIVIQVTTLPDKSGRF